MIALMEEKTDLNTVLLNYQKNMAQVKKYQAQQQKLGSKTERRKFYTSVLRSHDGWKTKDFNGMTFEQIEENFIPVWEKMHDFIPMDSKQESKRFKRPGIELGQRRLKTAKPSGSDLSQEQQAKDLKKLSDEELKKMMELVPVEDVYFEALAVKRPIIAWYVHSDGQIKHWKIVRVGEHAELHQTFEDMLKMFDREDLDKLWSLVQETHNSGYLSDDKEKEPWKLYDACGVHQVVTGRGHEIFMLVEKDYPLTKGITTLMIIQDEEVFEASSPDQEQFFQIQDYALWEVIEYGNSFKPTTRVTTNKDGSSTSTTITTPVTTEEKLQNKNDLKARSMLLMALPNEHILTFSQYKDVNTLFEAIKARFGGNDATKKTRKILLKQMYENFNAPSTESLDSIFNRLQKIISQLACLGGIISQEEQNLKFLRSLPAEWNTHVVVWRNKPDLDQMSFDDLYNNFKIVEQEVKRTVASSSDSGAQNVAFVSTPTSINDINTDSVQVNIGNTSVTTSSAISANISDATVYAFLSSQPNGSTIVYEDLDQIHDDELEDMDLKWNLALLSMRARKFYQRTRRKISIEGSDTTGYDKSKVECFNCHKMGHFARECRGARNNDNRARNQDNRSQDSSKKTLIVKDTSSTAMIAIDGT
ncbi:putative ribonuclease H-like domain-containing protein [Tanacetum coccineum]|uniref:Ribonuclease H-like domain-containing protein n=1 Tax=Tanacetum coccineum TaxID=301880 RepID=A0ABQ5AXX1_9ASTR